MNNKLKYLIYSCLIAVIISACAGFEKAVLGTRTDVPVYKESARELPVLGEQVIMDFRGGVGGWWSDPKYVITKSGSAMKVVATDVGPNYAPFGILLDEELNFTKVPFLRLKMKLAEGVKDYPTIRLDLIDAEDNKTNGAPATAIIDSAGYRYYIFDYFRKWKQTYPVNADVDPRKIVGMQVFVNPGGEKWSGTFFIDEVYSLANPDGSGVLPNSFKVDDFAGNVDWWSCNPNKVQVEKYGINKLRVKYTDSQWDCFGKVFGEVDITETPVIKIIARAKSETDQVETNILARFIDANENATDLVDITPLASTIKVNEEGFKEYYTAYKPEDLKSKDGVFDPKKVNKMIIFVNAAQPTNFTGELIVDEVSFVSSLP